ncbi:GntR family transcriptional regulator [Ochrobactrum sp. S46]|nr:GntR family transcriptional regulator [Ochrobactrum sp. S45]MBK0046123.1 GntR family transcriptional regulator [Ochrobactrum sp. S46]
MAKKSTAVEDVIHPQTIGEQAYQRIRSDILFGRLKPGQKLKLDALRTVYDTSISTLRETLNRLASEGLVVAEGQRGFEVAPVSIENLMEISELRLLLETHALQQSFAAGGVDWEGTVIACHHKLAKLEHQMADGDRSQTELWKRYDWEFHQSLISACGSQVLMETHASIFDQYLRYQMISLSFRGEIAAQEHQGLLDAALSRNAEAAIAILECHVNGGLEHALATGTIK